MDFNVITISGGKRVQLSGQFTFVDNQKFREILDLADDDEVRSLELDFSQVNFIDSAGLGMLLLLRDTCQNNQTSISLHGAHGQVEKIFTISKFDQLFTIVSKQ